MANGRAFTQYQDDDDEGDEEDGNGNRGAGNRYGEGAGYQGGLDASLPDMPEVRSPTLYALAATF